MIRRAMRFTLENSVLLILGAAAGLFWANLAPESYFKARDLSVSAVPWLGEHLGSLWRGADVRFVVNDILMALFFALVGKEVWEALLPGGSLHRPRSAATPVLCAVGGMVAPAAIYLLLARLCGQWEALHRGWAIPCATDIAFSYLIARRVFGKRHPAVAFLLLLAIADDAFGLLVLAVFYPVQAVRPGWLALSALAVGLGVILRRGGARSFWWYLAGPGALSWLGFYLSGLHPALGLLPIIPTMPHARVAAGTPHWEASRRHDTLDRFEAFWIQPVQGILCAFGLLNAGVVLGAVGAPTGLVLAGLLVGKPIGIFITGLLCVRLLGLQLSEEIGPRELFVTGCAAGIGFTVALFVATVAFPGGAIQDAAKIGALASCAAAATAVGAAQLLRVRVAGAALQREGHTASSADRRGI